jgi:plastocyanin
MSDTPSENSFNVGDKVTWTHVTLNGNRHNLSTREGVIVGLHGNYAVTVKKRNGRKEIKSVSEVTHIGQRSHLTKAFIAIAEAAVADLKASTKN